ncbi:MAG: arginine decarboxylase, pyruvoyl-dependent [Acidobacteriota bacterium]
MVPKKLFLTKGVGRHREKLASFEEALRDAEIAPFNLVKTSSIFPPKCELISKQEGIKLLKPGQVIFCILSENSTNEPHRLIVASVGIAIPKNKNTYGYLSEHHSFGQREEDAGDYAEELAASMLATTLGLPFDLEKSWDEKKGIFKISDKIVTTRNITQSAVGKKGVWTTVIAGAIFIF